MHISHVKTNEFIKHAKFSPPVAVLQNAVLVPEDEGVRANI